MRTGEKEKAKKRKSWKKCRRGGKKRKCTSRNKRGTV